MEIKPIKTGRRNYPTLQETLDKPELLEKNAPARWLKNGAVSGGLIILFLIVSLIEAAPLKERRLSKTADTITRLTPLKHTVAPIFYHGKEAGVGDSTDVGSPVSISEKAALKIIRQILIKHKIEMDSIGAPSFTYKGAYVTTHYETKKNTEHVFDREYRLDGHDAKRNLVIEYVSKYDFFGMNKTLMDRTDYSKRGTIASAEIIRNDIIQKDQFNAVVFYETWEWSGKYYDDNKLKKVKIALKKKVIKNLRAQVADFIVWAKKEGLIK